MAARLRAVALGYRAGSTALRGASSRATAAAAAPAGLLARGPDRPDNPSRNPDIYPPGHYKPDSPVPDPLNPDPDLYPPDVGVPRRDPDIVPPRYPSPDIYPPADNPDMPEPLVPGKGPYMSCWGFGGATGTPPEDIPKSFGTALGSSSTPRAPYGASPRQQRQGASPLQLLLKTDGGDAWLEARARGLHGGAAAGHAAGGQHPGRGLSGEEQEAANQTRAATEGVQKRDDQAPTQSYVEERSNTHPEVTPRVPTEAPDMVPAGSPRVSDDLGDVPVATHTRTVKPKVGPKASTGTPLDVPIEVPQAGLPQIETFPGLHSSK